MVDSLAFSIGVTMVLTKKKVLVTGSSGFIGQALCEALHREYDDIELVTLDRQLRSESDYGNFVCCDILEMSIDELVKLLEGVDTIFHLAAARTDWGLSYTEYERDNVFVTEKLVSVAEAVGIKNWIYFGTVGVYGHSKVALHEEAPFRPESDYAITKALAEEILLTAGKINDWNIRIIRPSAVYSPQQPENTNLYRLIEAIRLNRFIMIGNGGEIKSVSYLYNLIDATLWLYSKLNEGGIEAYNYVDSPNLTTKELVNIIRDELQINLPLISVPLVLVEWPAKVFDTLAALFRIDLPVTSARIKKFCTATNFNAEKILKTGFLPKYKSMEAVRETARWHRSLGG